MSSPNSPSPWWIFALALGASLGAGWMLMSAPSTGDLPEARNGLPRTVAVGVPPATTKPLTPTPQPPIGAGAPIDREALRERLAPSRAPSEPSVIRQSYGLAKEDVRQLARENVVPAPAEAMLRSRATLPDLNADPVFQAQRNRAIERAVDLQENEE